MRVAICGPRRSLRRSPPDVAFAARRHEAASWLYGIAYRQLAQYHRRGAIEQRALRRLATEPPPLSDGDLERLNELAGIVELGGEIDTALRHLPPALLDAVSLRVIDELPYTEVAERLNITPQAARVRVSRALRTLRAAIPNYRNTP